MKWRDWKNLPTDLVMDIADRLLTLDVAEYLRFRAACKPWRDCTDNPRAGDGMDARFRPRDWIVLYRCGHPSGRTLVNVATGARANVDFPELATKHQLGTADGLLVLLHEGGNDVSVLNPLTGALIRFPPLTVDPADHPSCLLTLWPRVDPRGITGAGIDDSTSPCTLLLCLRPGAYPIVCAKPGDENWVYGRVAKQGIAHMVSLVQSPVTLGGRCYFTTVSGRIMSLDLSSGSPWPFMKFLLDEDPPVTAQTTSFLVRSQGRMLMVRYMFGNNLMRGGGYNETEIFMWRGRQCRVEVFEVDMARRRLVPQSGVGNDHAAFLAGAGSVMVSTKKFPKIAANSVYLNYYLQQLGHFRAYCFQDRTTTQPRARKGRNGELDLCACHWELEDYLIRNVANSYFA
ncbi:hypothetical protein QYE76_029964 [Lolium multiflorum]|uniref:KIB1-4 beta-propeller domain-containing protein n=1 Tax=Lolium multiflorum TaxID=4521 RepID=A0AAD8VID7_LOLMU|nr:hypothetical protein QYE76_029964 [Lolium multiflorum]